MTRRKRARRARMTFIPFQAAITLGTLADQALLSAAILTFGEDFFCVGVKATWALRGLTADEQPIDVGFAHGDLSDTEIGEFLVAEFTDPDDIIAVERGRRPVRKVGSFSESGLTDMVLNDGVPITVRFKRSVGDTHTMDIWAVNRTGATLTTGAALIVNGHLYGRWQR